MAPPLNFVPAISPDVPWHTAQHIRMLYQKLASNAQAIAHIHAGVENITNTTIQETAGSGTTPAAPSFPGLGGINDQTGNTAYTLSATDNGIFLILNDASPVAVTLNSAMGLPYFFLVSNWGLGTVTYTPTSGNINGAASWVQPQGGLYLVAFDGTDWKTSDALVLPQSFTAATHKFLKSYDAATGAFTDAQAAFTDILGTISVGQLPASGVTAGSYTNTNLTVDAEGRVTAAANGTSSGLNFADAEIPAGVVDGANVTFTLANTPTPALSLQLYLNGLIQHQGIGNDYTLSAATITFASAPSIGGTVLAWYRY